MTHQSTSLTVGSTDGREWRRADSATSKFSNSLHYEAAR